MSNHKYSSSTNWDNTAAEYAQHIEQVTGGSAELLIDMCDKLKPFSASESYVLDSGAGSGVLTSCLGTRYPSMAILATDLSAGMLEIIDKKSMANVKTKVIDANDTSGGGLGSAIFTHALSTMMLQFLNTPQTALEEMHRILQPRGVIGIGIWGKIDTAEPWFQACEQLRPEFKRAGDFFDASAWRTTEVLEKALRAAGFGSIESQAKKFELKFDSADEYLAHWWDMKNPGIENMINQFPGERAEIRPVFDADIRKRYERGEKFYLETVLASGIKI